MGGGGGGSEGEAGDVEAGVVERYPAAGAPPPREGGSEVSLRPHVRLRLVLETDGKCTPLYKMPFNSRDEGSKCVESRGEHYPSDPAAVAAAAAISSRTLATFAAAGASAVAVVGGATAARVAAARVGAAAAAAAVAAAAARSLRAALPLAVALVLLLLTLLALAGVEATVFAALMAAGLAAAFAAAGLGEMAVTTSSRCNPASSASSYSRVFSQYYPYINLSSGMYASGMTPVVSGTNGLKLQLTNVQARERERRFRVYKEAPGFRPAPRADKCTGPAVQEAVQARVMLSLLRLFR